MSPNNLVPTPLFKLKVLGFTRLLAVGTQSKQPQMAPVPQLLTGNSVLRAEIRFHGQREMVEEERWLEAVFSNINTFDCEASLDNLPVSDTPGAVLFFRAFPPERSLKPSPQVPEALHQYSTLAP